MTQEQYDGIILRLNIMIEKRNQPIKTVYTIDEVSKFLKVSRDTIDRTIKKGQLQALRIGDWRKTKNS